MTIVDKHPIFEQTQDFVRLIDKRLHDEYYGEEFEKSPQYQADIEHLSELQEKCRARTIENMRRAQKKAHERVVENVSASDVKTPAYLRKHLNKRYDVLVEQNRQIRALMDDNVERKKYGRELKERLSEVLKKKASGNTLTKEDRNIINEILRF